MCHPLLFCHLSLPLSAAILRQQDCHPCRQQVLWGPNDPLLPNGNQGSPAASWSFRDRGTAKQSTARSRSISTAYLSPRVLLQQLASSFFYHYHSRHDPHDPQYCLHSPPKPPRCQRQPSLRKVVCLFNQDKVYGRQYTGSCRHTRDGDAESIQHNHIVLMLLFFFRVQLCRHTHTFFSFSLCASNKGCFVVM